MDLNTMLREAITTDSRKRKCIWQDNLEAMGYKIIKDRCWTIINPTTKRRISLDYNSNYLHTTNSTIRFGRIWTYKGYINKPLEIINLERLLNKNIISERSYGFEYTDVELMSRALHTRKLNQERLNDAWSEFQAELEKITREYNKKLADAKSSYEWGIEYSTREIKDANDTIDKLLKRKTA